MSDFNQRVYEIVSRIPPGRLCTYGQIALMAGSPRASRIVGAAMLHAPPGLPCHRVVYRDGSLCCGQAFGGQAIQRQMLEADLKRHLWLGEE